MRRRLIALLSALVVGVPAMLGSCSGETARDAPNTETAGSGDAAVPAASDAWVEYTVTGDVTASGREQDVVMCARTGAGFEARTLGDWYITIEADRFGFGRHAARFSVTAPVDVIPRTSGGGTSYRLEGTGQITVADAGQGQMGMSLVTVDFSASGLVNEDERTIDVQGKLSCALM